MLQGEHSAIIWTFIKLPFVIKIFVLSIFERLFYTGFTAHIDRISMVLPNVYFKGSQVEFSKLCISIPEIYIIFVCLV